MIKAEDELDRGVLNAQAAQWFCFVHDEFTVLLIDPNL